MLRTVPFGRSRFGCGTVTRPGRSECFNWTCEPFRRTSTQPACRSLRSASRLFMVCIVHTSERRINTRIHTGACGKFPAQERGGGEKKSVGPCDGSRGGGRFDSRRLHHPTLPDEGKLRRGDL